MRVAVLGHHGMLGRVVARRFRELGAEVVTSNIRYPDLALIDFAAEADAVVNCIGRKDGNLREMVFANEALPSDLALIDKPVVHASTDAVGESSFYARTKAAGEADGLIIVRSSIVGTGGGLLGWLESQQGRTVTGYTDHIWHGITTLEWADLAWELLRDPRPRLVIPGCRPPVSKFVLLSKARNAFRWDVNIIPRESGTPVDRTQALTYPLPGIGYQLRRLAKWTR